MAAGQALDGEIIRAMQAMARRAEMWLSLGGFPEKTTLDGVDKVFNTHLIIDDLGSVQAVYRKIHLFDVVSTSMSPIVRYTPLRVPPIGRLETTSTRLTKRACLTRGYDVCWVP